MAVGGSKLRETLRFGSDAFIENPCLPCAKGNKEIEAIKYCVDCDENICEKCELDHKRFSVMKCHRIEDKPRSQLCSQSSITNLLKSAGSRRPALPTQWTESREETSNQFTQHAAVGGKTLESQKKKRSVVHENEMDKSTKDNQNIVMETVNRDGRTNEQTRYLENCDGKSGEQQKLELVFESRSGPQPMIFNKVSQKGFSQSPTQDVNSQMVKKTGSARIEKAKRDQSIFTMQDDQKRPSKPTQRLHVEQFTMVQPTMQPSNWMPRDQERRRQLRRTGVGQWTQYDRVRQGKPKPWVHNDQIHLRPGQALQRTQTKERNGNYQFRMKRDNRVQTDLTRYGSLVTKPSADGRNISIRKTDMSEEMQQEAVECALDALQNFNMECDFAEYIKKEFDEIYSPDWHCVVGINFGSFVSHKDNTFIYFYVGETCFLLFKN